MLGFYITKSLDSQLLFLLVALLLRFPLLLDPLALLLRQLHLLVGFGSWSFDE